MAAVNPLSAQQEQIVALSKGNPGALRVCCELVKAGRADLLTALERRGIRGPAIWLAFKDFGDETIPTMIAVLDNTPEILVSSLRKLGYLSEASAR